MALSPRQINRFPESSLGDYIFIKSEDNIIQEFSNKSPSYIKYLAAHKNDRRYVVKKITPRGPLTLEFIQNEVDVLKEIAKYGCKSNLLCYTSSFIENGSMYVVTDAFLNSQSLEYVIRNDQTYLSQVNIIFSIFYQICEGLNYLHNTIGIAHNDLKPDNILINNNYQIQIIDFGLSCNHLCQVIGTVEYSPPELINTYINFNPNREPIDVNINKKADVFAMGVTFYKLVNKRYPYIYPEETMSSMQRATRINNYYLENGVIPSNYNYSGDIRIDGLVNEYLNGLLQLTINAIPSANRAFDAIKKMIAVYNYKILIPELAIDTNNLLVQRPPVIVEDTQITKQKYHIISKLGKGAFGDAYMCIREPSVFIKEYLEPVNVNYFNNEIQVLNRIKYFTCKSTLECFVESYQLSSKYFIVTQTPKDFNNVITLYEFIYQNKIRNNPIREDVAIKIIEQCIDTLIYINMIDIIKSNINPLSILIHNTTYDITFVDFDSLCHTNCIYLYSSPEVLAERIASQVTMSPIISTISPWSAQVFSLGVVFYNLLNLEHPGKFGELYTSPDTILNYYQSIQEIGIKIGYTSNIGQSSVLLNQELKTMLSLMLRLDPEERITPDILGQTMRRIINEFCQTNGSLCMNINGQATMNPAHLSDSEMSDIITNE